VNSNLILLRPYKAKYLTQAVRVRETVTYAYLHGGASLMDFLNAQSDYRNVQTAYLQLIGSYLTAALRRNIPHVILCGCCSIVRFQFRCLPSTIHSALSRVSGCSRPTRAGGVARSQSGWHEIVTKWIGIPGLRSETRDT
jgi:hypothetical protein